MKSLLHPKFILLLSFLITGFAQLYAQDIFETLSDRDDVESVYLSKSVVSLADPNMLKMGKLNLRNQKFNINSIIIIETTKSSGIDACTKAIKKFLSDNKDITMLMRNKDASSCTTIYGIPAEQKNANGKKTNTPNTFTTLLLYSLDQMTNNKPQHCNIIVITGDIYVQ